MCAQCYIRHTHPANPTPHNKFKNRVGYITMTGYRLRSKAILLTWSQLDAEHIDVFTALDSYMPISRTVIARELHADGQPHIHAYVEFTYRPDRVVTTQLDIGGRHPNIEPKSSKAAQTAAAEYCRKDTNWIQYGFDDAEETTEETIPASICDTANEYDSWTDFLDWGLRARIPYAYVQAAWAAKNNTPPPTLAEGDEVLGTIRSNILRFMQFDASSTRALVLEGSTGVGKTVWAKRNMPRPSIFVSHIDDLKHLRVGYHRSIIFDDMSFNGDLDGKGKWPIPSQIHLVDFENQRSIHTRYLVSVIPAGIFKCFTCNVGRFPLAYDAAIQRRIYHILC